MSDWPINTPVFGTALVEHIAAQRAAEGERPMAAPTTFRASQASGCSRRLALEAHGVQPTRPMDEAGVSVTHMGTLRHEAFEKALAAKFDDAICEVEGQIGDLVSFHADFALLAQGVVGELKNVGQFAFDKAVGINRRQKKRANAEGPKIGAKLQGALCAHGLGAETLVIVYFASEAVSVQTAAALGLSESDRWMAEWHYPRSVWEPWAEAELNRLKAIAADKAEGLLSDRWAIDDNGSTIYLDPEATKVPWQCDYCGQRDTCEALGPGVVPVPVSLRSAS